MLPNAGRKGAGQGSADATSRRYDVLPLQPVLALGAASFGQKGDQGRRGLCAPDAARQIVEVIVCGPSGQRIKGAEITYTHENAVYSDVARADSHGRALLEVPMESGQGASQLVVEAKGYWGRRIFNPVLQPTGAGSGVANMISLRTIRGPAVDSLSWGVEAMGLDVVSDLSFLGQRAMRCALILAEAGRAGMGPPLVLGAAELAGLPQAAPARCRGLSVQTLAMASLLHLAAPEAEVAVLPLSVRPAVRDAIAAIEWSIAHGMDVVCLCFVALQADDRLHAALKRARRAGVLVICPVGDRPGPVPFPAACHEVLAVAAVGHDRASPKGSAHAALNGARGWEGYCLSGLTAHGAGIDLVAPGIAVPIADQVLSGSVVAAVHLAGFALCLLQTDETMLRAARSGVRLLELVSALRASCMDLGFPSDRQGAGMPVWGQRGRARKPERQEAHMACQAQTVLDRIAQRLV